MVASYRSATTTRTWVIDSGASYNYGNNLRDFRKNSVKETNMIIKYKQRRKELYVWEEWILRRSSFRNSEYLSFLGANLEDGLYILSTDGSAHICEIKMLRTASHSHSNKHVASTSRAP